MRTTRWFTVLTAFAALALSSCGGSSNCGTSFANSCGGSAGGPVVNSVLLVSDNSTIPSDNSLTANLTAYVRDASNNFVSGVPVAFAVDTGGVSVTQGTTDANGVATATLSTLGDKTNRTITITATASKIVATATVGVVGSVLQVQGPKALTAGQQATYTVSLNDSGANGISGVALTVQAPSNLTVDTTSLTTDTQGRATFNATGGGSGTGTLTVSGLGLSALITVGVNGDVLSFTAPAANSNIPLQTVRAATVHWVQNGVAVANAQINFATTRGCINPAGIVCTGQPTTAQATTDNNGIATVNVLSDNAGGATVTATTTGGTNASIAFQFIATTPAFIDVQPSVFSLAPNDQSTISAVVRDVNNNLVTGSTVVFSLNDVTGGTLTTASAVTDLEGRAQTVYTAGTVTSATSGVQITATVQSKPTIFKTVGLTVAARQVFISIGTGNEIREPNPAQYALDYVVQVTDSTGAGVKGVSLAMSVISKVYFKGIRFYNGTAWFTCYTIPQDEANCIIGTPPTPPSVLPGAPTFVTYGCADEDFNRNGQLDPGENKNGNNPATISPGFPTGYPTIEAGNIATVSATNAGSLVTDDNGFAFATVYYPQEYAYYLQVILEAQAAVQGTAFSASSTLLLPGSAADFPQSATPVPPGPISPFGKSNTCSDML